VGRKKAAKEDAPRTGRKKAVKKRSGRKKAKEERKFKQVANFLDRTSATRKVSIGDGEFKHEIMLINFGFSHLSGMTPSDDFHANGECGSFRVTVTGPKYDATVIAFISAIESIGFEIEDEKYGSEKSKAKARSPECEIR